MRELTIINPEASRDQSKVLPEIAKIGGGAPSTRWKENFKEFK